VWSLAAKPCLFPDHEVVEEFRGLNENCWCSGHLTACDERVTAYQASTAM